MHESDEFAKGRRHNGRNARGLSISRTVALPFRAGSAFSDTWRNTVMLCLFLGLFRLAHPAVGDNSHRIFVLFSRGVEAASSLRTAHQKRWATLSTGNYHQTYEFIGFGEGCPSEGSPESFLCTTSGLYQLHSLGSFI